MPLPGDRKAKAAYEIGQKKRKIRAAQILLKERKTGINIPKTLSQEQDIASYMAETMGPKPPKRTMAGKVKK